MPTGNHSSSASSNSSKRRHSSHPRAGPAWARPYSVAMSCFCLPRRSRWADRPKEIDASSHRTSRPGVHRVLRRLTVSNLLSPAENGQSRRLSIVTTNDPAIAAAAVASAPPEAVVITLAESTQASLRYIFDDHCTYSSTFSLNPLNLSPATRTMSRARLQYFLRNTQGEATILPLAKERYTFHDFLEVLYGQHSRGAERSSAADPLDLSMPISHYFISSSHNTYLVGNQLSSEASVDEYRKVLENNCRCIEIDVWNPPYKSAKQSRDRSKSPSSHGHRRHASSGGTITPSIQDGIEAVTTLLTGRITRSRASSTSQQSLSARPNIEPTRSVNAESGRGGPVSPGRAPRTSRSRSREPPLERVEDDEAETINEKSIVAGDDASKDPRDTATLADSSEFPSRTTSETLADTITTKISVTAPGGKDDDAKSLLLDELFEDDAEPVVMHAHNVLHSDVTLGTYIRFRDVCRAVRSSAFKNSSLPVIVSLEVHTNAVQQRKMVKIMKEEWGNLLVDHPLEGTDPRLSLPTLGELQHRILVKVKKPSPVRALSGPSSTAGSTNTNLGTSLAVFAMDNASSYSDEEGNGNIAIPNSANANGTSGAQSAAAVTITEELGSLAVYTESKHFHKFSDRESKAPGHIFSLSETSIQTLHEKQHVDLFQHNKIYMMRAYPNATKHITSSNPDPARCWRRGVQMVALNWQTLDKSMMLNHGMFAGSPGYVLKPPGYRTSSSTGTSNGHSQTSKPPTNACPVAAAEPPCTIDLYITIISGQFLPLPPTLLKKAGISSLSAGPATAVSGRIRDDFRPVVRCELNVERTAHRCPETLNGPAPAPTSTVSAPAPAPSLVPNASVSAMSAPLPPAPTPTPTSTTTLREIPQQTCTPTATPATMPRSLPTPAATPTPTPTSATAPSSRQMLPTPTPTPTSALAPRPRQIPSPAPTPTTSAIPRRTPSKPKQTSGPRVSVASLASVSVADGPSGVAKIPEAVLKQKTEPGHGDNPKWGKRSGNGNSIGANSGGSSDRSDKNGSGVVLRFMNVRGIVESLSFVGFYVEDEASWSPQELAKQALGRNANLAGWACMRLDRLEEGYRFVSLLDAKGNPTEGKLLVRIEKLRREEGVNAFT